MQTKHELSEQGEFRFLQSMLESQHHHLLTALGVGSTSQFAMQASLLLPLGLCSWSFLFLFFQIKLNNLPKVAQPI